MVILKNKPTFINKTYIQCDKGGEVENMVRHWEDQKKIVAGIGSAGLWGHFFWFLGLIFAVLGAIWDAMDTTYGLTSMSWFLLAIVMSLLGIPLFLGVAMGWYLKSK